MNLLLDTSVFLWYITDHPKLTLTLRELLRNPENTVFVSAVSIWETLIKHQTGKLHLPEHPHSYLSDLRIEHNFQSLAIDESTISFLPSLPYLHRDPFDRMLICQALQYGLTIVTSDGIIPSYPVATIKVK